MSFDLDKEEIAEAVARKDVAFLVTAYSDLQNRIAELETEVAKPLELRLEEMRYFLGQTSATFEHPLIQEIAKIFVDTFKGSGGINYVGCTVTDKRDGETYELIMQKKSGKTPSEVNEDLKARIAELERTLKEQASSLLEKKP